MSNIDSIRISSLPDSREITDNDYVIIEQADGTRKANIQTINKKTNDTMVSLDKKIVDVTNSIKESNVSLDATINKVSNIDTKIIETEKNITTLSSQMEETIHKVNFLDELKLKLVYGVKANANYFNKIDKRFYEDKELTKLASDDSVSFQNAINDIIAGGGGELKIGIGNYYFAKRVYINPPKAGIPFYLNGYKVQSADEDYYKSVDGSYGRGVNIICDTDIAFGINMKADGNQFNGVASAQFDCFYASGIRFLGMYQGEESFGNFNAPIFKPSIGFQIIGTRYNIQDCAGFGMSDIIYQPFNLPDGSANYSDFVKVKNISGRRISNYLVRACRSDVSIFEGIYCEQAQKTLKAVLNVVGGINVNIKCIMSAMNYDYNQSKIYESSVVKINSSDCVNIDNTYCEKNYNYEGVISISDSTNVKIVNVAEHGVRDYGVGDFIKIRNSDVDIKGIHIRSIRKNGKVDINIIQENPKEFSKLTISGVDIKNGSNDTIYTDRDIVIKGNQFLTKYSDDFTRYVDVKYENSVFLVTNDKGQDVKNLYGIPKWEVNKLSFVNEFNGTVPLILRVNKSLNNIINSNAIIGYDGVITLNTINSLNVSFFNNGIRVQTPDDRVCVRFMLI